MQNILRRVLFMPKRPRSPCRWNGCPQLTEESYCKEHKKLVNRLYNRWKRDKNTYKSYGKTWRKIRLQHINEHPLCEVCKQKGMLTPANEVHHIIPLSEGGTNETSNLMSLCKSCHSRITATEGGRWG